MLGMLAATGEAMTQIFDPTVAVPAQWHYHVVVSDGLFQGLFAMVLCASMLVWRPTDSSKGQYARAPTDGQTIGAAADTADGTWDDDDADAETGNKVAVADELPADSPTNEKPAE